MDVFRPTGICARKSDCHKDLFIFSVTDSQYKAIQAPIPSPCAHTFFLLMKVTQQPRVFATLLGLDSICHSWQ